MTNNLIQPLGLFIMKLPLLLKKSVESFNIYTLYIPVQLRTLILAKKNQLKEVTL